jgi:hypothetical protein
MMTPWFDPVRFATLYGGLCGGLLGGLGGVLGAATGVLAPRGKAKSVILGAFTLFMMIGLVNLALGVYAVLDGQPWAIYYPLLLIGIVLSCVFGALRPVVRKRYLEAEALKMDAASFRRA